VKELIAVFGGLRFRYMDLFRLEGGPLLLDACAETLDTLRLHTTFFGHREDFLRKECKRES
jgi:hypothetical protein